MDNIIKKTGAPRFLNRITTLLAGCLLLGGLFGNVQWVSAQGYTGDPSNGEVATIENGCMQDVFNAFGQDGDLNCTANDVSLASATNITITDEDGCAFPGDTVTFRADFEVDVTSGSRRDVGIYFTSDGNLPDRKVCMAPDGTLSGGSISECLTDADCSGGKVCLPDGALTGECTISTLPYAPPSTAGGGDNWIDLDLTNDTTRASNDFGYCSLDGGATRTDPIIPCDGGSPEGGDAICVAKFGEGATCEEFGPGIQDICGDISKPDSSPLFPTIELTVTCVDADGDDQLDLPYCTSWRQDGANELCLTPLAAYPGTKSKCNCDAGFGIPINVPGQIIVDKVTYDFQGNLLPGNPTSFDFELTGYDDYLGSSITPVTFSLKDADAPFASLSINRGTYQITETVPDGWELTIDPSSSCTNDNRTPSDPSDDTTFDYVNGGDIELGSGEIITCTVNNTLTFVPTPLISIIKTATIVDLSVAGPADTMDAGDEITYQFEVQNTGNVDLTDVSVSDPLIESQIGGEAQLAACDRASLATGYDPDTSPSFEPPFEGESYTCEAIYTVTQEDLNGQGNSGTCIDESGASYSCIPNIATATGTGDNREVTDTDPEEVELIPNPSILIEKSGLFNDESGDGFAQSGETITYTYQVTNDGNQTLTSLSVTDSFTAPGDIANLGDITCAAIAQGGTLNPGDTTTCTATYTLDQADVDNEQVNNLADADATDPDGANVNDDDPAEVLLPANPAIDLVKTITSVNVGGDGRIDAGDTIDYSFSIENTGNVTLTSVDLTDTLVGYNDVTCGGVTELAPGESTTCAASYTILQSDIDAGQISNTATATGNCPDGTVDCVEDTETLIGPAEIQEPSILADKVITGNADEDGSGTITVGDTLTYTITATNTGNVTLYNVDVSDDLTETFDVFCAAELAPGDDCSVDVTYVVQLEDQGAYLNNTGTVTGDCPVSYPGVPEDCVTDEDPEQVLVFGDVCDPDKPLTLTLLYEGDPDSDNDQLSDSVILADGYEGGQDPAYIIMYDHNGRVIEEGLYEVGDLLVVKPVKGKRIPSRVILEIYDETGTTLLETVEFHSSCSEPLFVGDEFGSFTLVGST